MATIEMGPNKSLTLERSSPEVETAFGLKEHVRRADALRALMTDHGIDVLFLSDPSDINWLTGFKAGWYQANGHSGWPPSSGVAIHARESKLLFFETEKERLLAQSSTQGVEFHLLPRYSKPLIEFAVDDIAAEGWLEGTTVGLELQSYRPFPSVSHAFRELIEAAGAAVVDGTDAVRAARRAKSLQERAYVRSAAAIADAGIRAGIEACRVGASELSVYGRVVHGMTQAGGEIPSTQPSVLSGGRTVHTQALPTRKPLLEGDLVTLVAYGCYHRYHAQVARTVVVGRAPAFLTAAMELAAEGMAAVPAALRAGQTAQELGDAVEGALAGAGAWEAATQVFVHDVGISFSPEAIGSRYLPIGDGTPLGDESLGAGETIALQASFAVPELAACLRLGETLILGDEGAVPLSGLGHELEPPSPDAG